MEKAGPLHTRPGTALSLSGAVFCRRGNRRGRKNVPQPLRRYERSKGILHGRRYPATLWKPSGDHAMTAAWHHCKNRLFFLIRKPLDSRTVRTRPSPYLLPGLNVRRQGEAASPRP